MAARHHNDCSSCCEHSRLHTACTFDVMLTVCPALFDELGLLVFVHGAMYVAFAALEQPQSIRSVGLHQTIGDCNATTALHTPFGQVCLCL